MARVPHLSFIGCISSKYTKSIYLSHTVYSYLTYLVKQIYHVVHRSIWTEEGGLQHISSRHRGVDLPSSISLHGRGLVTSSFVHQGYREHILSTIQCAQIQNVFHTCVVNPYMQRLFYSKTNPVCQVCIVNFTNQVKRMEFRYICYVNY